LKEYSAKKYGRRREFVDAETRARLGLWIDEGNLPENPPEQAGEGEQGATEGVAVEQEVASPWAGAVNEQEQNADVTTEV
jgi:hypothetical protein